ncbi:MAG: VWA domain-containing protein [Bacteroidales bacterium]|nr:VWA domain-containing protein [Bacteroidales bacterium]
MAQQSNTPDRGFGRKIGAIATPRVFHQLGILVLDGSGSMKEGLSARKINLAQEVSTAVKDTFTLFKTSSNRNNFSFAVVYYDNTAKIELDITPAPKVDDMRAYDPTVGMSGTTSIAEGLKLAKQISDKHLSGQEDGGIPKSVVIVILSDGLDMTEQETLSIANTLKSNDKITITSCFFETLGGDRDGMNEAANFLKKLCTSEQHFNIVFDAEKVKNFFVASVSNKKKI